MYALESYDPEAKQYTYTQKIKGVGKRAAAKELTFTDFIKTLDTNVQKYVTMYNIQSMRHRVSTVSLVKKATDPFEDKRFWIDSVRSLAYGHKDCCFYE